MSRRQQWALGVAAGTLPLLVVFFLLNATVARAQAVPKSRAAAPSVNRLGAIHIQSSLVVAPFAATDRAGNFVENLNEHEVRVFDDGIPQRITQFSLTTEPVAAVIVVQTNETAAPFLDGIRPLGPVFSNLLLGSPGQAAVLTYADKSQVVQDFSNDPGKLETTLRYVTADGSKARLNDALGRAILMLANQTKRERRVIVVFSDGSDRGSETRSDEIVRAASDANIAIYGLRFDPRAVAYEQANGRRPPVSSEPCYGAMSGNPSQALSCQEEGMVDFLSLGVLAAEMARAPFRDNLLAHYAASTGGEAYTHWKARTLQNQLQKIALEVNSQYVLAYTPSTLKQTGFHPIQIEVSRPDLTVRARAGYFYGPQGGGR